MDYGSSDLSKTAQDYRLTNNITEHNVSVIEYKVKVRGKWVFKTEKAHSSQAGHAERLAWKKLQKKGIKPGQVTRIYSELTPCDSGPRRSPQGRQPYIDKRPICIA